MKLLFATTNKGKLPHVVDVLGRHGVEVVQEPLDIPELQAEKAGDVAREKVRWAFERLGKPVMVIDSAFHIARLGGFPGTNVKWATKQIGLEGYLALLDRWQSEPDRGCHFEDALAFFDAGLEEPKIFLRKAHGRLAKEILGRDNPQAKSPLWKLFIPAGSTLTLAEMTAEELEAHRGKASIERLYDDFASWLVTR